MSNAERITDGELLRAILSNAPVRVALFDRDGRFLLDPDPNPPLASDAGAPAGSKLLEVYGDVPGIRDAVRRAFAGEAAHLTRQRGGATYVTAFLPRPSASGEVQSVLAIATMITEGSSVERALAELQARERRLFNSSMIGLIYWDDSGAITEANDTFLQIVGYTREDVAQGLLDWVEMTPPEFRYLDEL